MTRGTGPSLGAALRAYLEALAGGRGGRRRSYQAKGWHAQVSALTKSPRGPVVTEAAGLTVSRRTLLGWLAETAVPSAENRRKINEAYEMLAGAFPESVKSRTLQITGVVDIAHDVRDRGNPGGGAALKINGRNGNWSAIEEAWEDDWDELSDDELEDLYYEHVMIPDLDISDTMAFPGGSYSIS